MRATQIQIMSLTEKNHARLERLGGGGEGLLFYKTLVGGKKRNKIEKTLHLI